MTSTELRVLICAPTDHEATPGLRMLRDASFECHVCDDLDDLCHQIARGAGAVLLTEESIAGRPMPLVNQLKQQETWSDLPIVLLADEGADAAGAVWAMDMLGNVSVLERPVRKTTLVSAMRAALRARRRQYELRDHLEASSQLGAIVQSSADAIIGETVSGLIRSWNVAAERLFGYPAAHAVGRSLGFLLPPEERSADEAALARVRAGGPAELLESVWIDHEGRPRDVTVALSAVRDAAGEFIGSSRIVRDIGDRLRTEAALRETEERFRIMADSAPVLIWVSDPIAAHIWFNRPWLEFTGHRIEHEVGMGWARGMHPDDRARCLETYASAFEARSPFQMEYRLRRHDGEYRWLFDTGRPVFDPRGTFLGYIGSCIDITERRDAEERLQLSDRRKDEFLATLGHELRNPLSPIRNGLELLRLDASGAMRQRTVGMLERQVDHLVRLVDDLLEVSRVSRGRLELRRAPTDLNQVVTSAVEASRPLLEQAELDLTVRLPDVPVMLDADAVRLTQVVANLLNNAVKYTERAGRIALTVLKLESEVEVSVQDTGVGIPEEMLPRVFDMFAQVNRTLGRSQGGLGIGLALVRRLVELHGGWIEARSEGEGLGSEFVFRLPLPVAEPASSPEEAVDDAEQGPGHRVLVIDDNADAAESLAQLLALKGHDVRVAHDGASGIVLARQFSPEIAFLDIGMPGLDGYQVARRLREEAHSPLCLIALTGYGQQQDRRRSLEAGFDGHMVKPLDLGALDALLRTGALPGAHA